jgi:hypothetical protein
VLHLPYVAGPTWLHVAKHVPPLTLPVADWSSVASPPSPPPSHPRSPLQSFHLVTARAVAELPVLAELCLPFVAPGGAWVAAKGADIQVGEGGKGVVRWG